MRRTGGRAERFVGGVVAVRDVVADVSQRYAGARRHTRELDRAAVAVDQRLVHFAHTHTARTSQLPHNYTMSPPQKKAPTCYFLNNSVKKLTDFTDFWQDKF